MGTHNHVHASGSVCTWMWAILLAVPKIEQLELELIQVKAFKVDDFIFCFCSGK